jgi:hypothetical protein
MIASVFDETCRRLLLNFALTLPLSPRERGVLISSPLPAGERMKVRGKGCNHIYALSAIYEREGYR